MESKQPFEHRFRRFAAVRQQLANATLAYRLGAVALFAGIFALLFLGGWLPSAWLNMALFLAIAVLLVGLLIAYPVQRAKIATFLGEAFFMEELFGDLNSRLVSAWDFLERKLFTPLTVAVIQRAKADLDRAFETKLDREERDLRRKRFFIALAVFVVLGLTPWFAFGNVASNFRKQWAAVRDALFPVNYELTISPDNQHRAYRLGEEVNVRLAFSRRGFEQVTLVQQEGDADPVRTELPVDAEHAVLTKLTSPTEAELKLHFEFGERQTDPVALIFTTPPSLVNMQTEIVPPSYTRMLPRTLEGVQQRLLGLPGTNMTLGFTFSKDLDSATITWDDGETLPLETVGRFASVSLVHHIERRGVLRARGVYGFDMEDPIDIAFDLQNDEQPRLFMPRHLKDDMPVLPEAAPLFGFGVRAQDDYGVTRCTLKWQKSTVDNPTGILERGEVERLISPSLPNAAANFEKVFYGLSLQPGDKLTFWVEATDNRAPKSQTTSSRRSSIFIYQEDLGGLSIKQLGFDKASGEKGRIAKSRRATTVKAPEGRRNTEKVRNEHETTIASSSKAPAVRGEHSQATRDYFRLLSGVSYNGKNPPGEKTPPDETTPPEGVKPPDGTTPGGE